MFGRVVQMQLLELLEEIPKLKARIEALEKRPPVAEKVQEESDLDFFHKLREAAVRNQANGRKNAGRTSD